MAEYIDREKVNFRCSYHGDCMFSGSKCDKCSDNVIDYQELMRVSPTDVVELSEYIKLQEQLNYWQTEHAKRVVEYGELNTKIDKTIADIENEVIFWDRPVNYHVPLDVQRMKQAKANSYRHALEIVKSNIGEQL